MIFRSNTFLRTAKIHLIIPIIMCQNYGIFLKDIVFYHSSLTHDQNWRRSHKIHRINRGSRKKHIYFLFTFKYFIYNYSALYVVLTRSLTLKTVSKQKIVNNENRDKITKTNRERNLFFKMNHIFPSAKLVSVQTLQTREKTWHLTNHIALTITQRSFLLIVPINAIK